MGEKASGQHRLAEVKLEGLRHYRQSLVSGQVQDAERVAVTQHSHRHLGWAPWAALDRATSNLVLYAEREAVDSQQLRLHETRGRREWEDGSVGEVDMDSPTERTPREMFLCTRLHLDSIGDGGAGLWCAEGKEGMEAAGETGPGGALARDSKRAPHRGHHQFHTCYGVVCVAAGRITRYREEWKVCFQGQANSFTLP